MERIATRRRLVPTAGRTLAALLSALTLGMAFAHVLELPPRLEYDAELWTRLTEPNALYQYWGVIGGPIEVAAVAALVTLALVVRHRSPARSYALAAAALHVLALVVWIAGVMPANLEIGTWSSNSIPPDWTSTRNQWEAAHATRFILLLPGFSALILALLSEHRSSPTPDEHGR